MLYEQKVKYMEYRESGTKVKGAGFVKMERWGEAWNLQLQISGLPTSCTGERGIYLCGGRKEVLLGLVTMDQGKGRLELQIDDIQEPSEESITVPEAERIRIPIGPEKEVVCILQEKPVSRAEESRRKPAEERSPMQPAAGESPAQSTGGESQPQAAAEEMPMQSAVEEMSMLSGGEGGQMQLAREEMPIQPAGGEDPMQSGEEKGQTQFVAEERHMQSVGVEKPMQSAGWDGPKQPAREEMPIQSAPDETKNTAYRAEDEKKRVERNAVEGIRQGEIRKETAQEPQRAPRSVEVRRVVPRDGGRIESQGEKNSPVQPEPPLRASSEDGEMLGERVQPYTFQTTLQPDKWEQLRAIYPPVRPFGDDREYLRISPGDFVILKDKSYRLANNSFLLHGYFNYKHLILHRSRQQGEIAYFVGVPGNFFDKEKEVAILFGFESFECAREPAKDGDYGYYMMRVEL